MTWRQRFIVLLVVVVCGLLLLSSQDFSQPTTLVQALPFGKLGRLLLNNRLTFKQVAEYGVEKIELLKNYDVMIADHAIIYNNESKFSPKNYKYEAPSLVKVHVVMHSHVDPGWLFTFEEYFHDKVHSILNLTVTYLSNNPDMRFIWSEMSFLERWWRVATDQQKTQMKQIVSNGQLELSGGAWVMTDEATPYFLGTIDNMIEGHHFVKTTFNMTPSTSWSVDPFGHGLMVPYLLSESGINSMVIGRLNNDLKAQLRDNHLLLFRWAQIWDSVGNLASPLVNALPRTYYTTSDSCGPDSQVCCQFDLGPSARSSCSSRASSITPENVDSYATKLAGQYKKLAPFYIGDSVLTAVGDDFFFSKDADWSITHASYKQLFEYINSHPEKFGMKVQFSTVKDFFDSVLATKASFPVFTGDFFPYTEDKLNTYPYWTGFYVHRPFFKRAERLTESKLRAVDLVSIMSSYSEVIENIRDSRRDLALCQHHDSITATSKPKVMDDYMARLEASFANINAQMQNIINKRIVPGVESFSLLIFPQNNNLDGVTNLHLITFTSDIKSHQLLIFHQNTKEMMQKIVLRVNDPRIQVSNRGNDVAAQILPVVDYAKGHISNQTFELVFFIELRPLEIKSIDLFWSLQQPESTILSMVFTADPQSLQGSFFLTMPLNGTSEFSLSNRFYSVKFTNGMVSSVRKSGDNMSLPLDVSYKNYVDHGGAYTFVNHGLSTAPLKGQNPIEGFNPIYIVGPLTSKAITQTSPALIQNVIVDNGNSVLDLGIHLELYSNQGSMDITQMMQIKTNIDSKDTFYTDINGMYFLKRTFNKQVKYEGNFYPMPSAAFIEDQNYRLTVLGGQPTGATVEDGIVNVMLDRRLSGEDGKGLGRGDASYSTPSLIKYDLVFEQKRQSDNDQSPLFYSSVSYFNLRNLLYQPELFVLRQQSPVINMFETFKWPCNIELVNVRYLDAKSGLILLRRLPFAPSLPQLDCVENDYKLLYDALLIFSQHTPLIKTSLTGTMDHSEVDPSNMELLFKVPLKIVALKFYLRG